VPSVPCARSTRARPERAKRLYLHDPPGVTVTRAIRALGRKRVEGTGPPDADGDGVFILASETDSSEITSVAYDVIGEC